MDLLSIMYESQTINDTAYEGDLIVEINRTTSEIVWNWSCWDHFDLSQNCSECIQMPSFRLPRDWTHINSIAYNDSEDTIIINSRNLDQCLEHYD